MADPTIQTFCCYSANSTETLHQIMQEFNTDAYNIVCLFSATVGMLGALYQILPRQQFSRNHRWVSFPAVRGRRIILWLAVSDLLASLGVLIRAALWLSYKNIMPAMDDQSSVLFCVVSSAWIQYFYTSTWVWTLCYAIDMRFILSEKRERVRLYHLAAWILPAILTGIGLCLLYFPDANCHMSRTATQTVFRILPNYIVTYIPIAVVMIANPCLYLFSCKDMEKIITCTSGQFTRRERDLIDAVKIKFSAINIVFYVCWFPNLINGFLLWTMWFQLPVTMVITTWYVMAFTNPLQALFNSLVYRRWNGESESLILPWSRMEKTHREQSRSSTLSLASLHASQEEQQPLLKSFLRPSSYKYVESL